MKRLIAAAPEGTLPPGADLKQIRSILGGFPGVVFATDGEGTLTLIHGQGIAATGVSSTEVIAGISVFELFKDHQALLHGIGLALSGQPCTTTVGFDNRIMEFWCGPLRDSEGEPAGMIGTAADITARLKTGEALRRTEEMLEAVVRSSPLGLAVLDMESKVRLWNPAAERIYGWTRDEVLGRRLPVIPEGEADGDLLTQQQIFTEGSTTDQECVGVRKDGALVPIGLSGAPLHNGAGEVTGAVYLAMDLTERKRSEEALRNAMVRAQAANRAKSEFLANMSHEIRTPMNAVIGMLQLVLDDSLTPEQEHYLNVARSAAESMMGLLSDILDFSRIESRTLELAQVDFDVRELLGNTAETLALQAHSKGLELTCQVAPGIPAVLIGDPLRLRQVLTNLLANAVKFTAHGEIGVVAGIESQDGRTATLRFLVSDTGIGVEQEKAAGLFDPFVLGDGSTTRKFGGVGLGLAISRQLVEMMGGQIGVDSEPGKGSTFWFTVVLGKVAQGQPVPEPKTQPDLTRVKALVVDDSGANRNLVSSLLKSWGARCRQAFDGASALAALEHAQAVGEPFQLAVVDMSLPGMDGEELGRQIAAHPALKDVALVLMTYPGQHFDPAGIQRIGFKAYVWKPVLAPRLAAAVAQAFNSGESDGSSVKAEPSETLCWQDRKRILVVEDDQASREVAVALLQKLGYDVDPVNNGVEALTALENVIYDAVLMDCEMPEMGGCEATERIRSWKNRAQNSAIPIIALTAHARACDRDKCLLAGMSDFLSKPIDARELALVLAKWIGSPSAEAPVRVAEDPLLSESGPVFEAEGLLRRLGGSRDLAARVVERFVEETPQRLKLLRCRIEQCDSSGAQAQAQAFKRNAATVSGASLCALASAIEEAAGRFEFKNAAALLPQVEEQFRQFVLASRTFDFR